MSNLGRLNYYILQFAGVRIARAYDGDRLQSYGVIFALPFTGWNNTPYCPPNPKYHPIWTLTHK